MTTIELPPIPPSEAHLLTVTPEAVQLHEESPTIDACFTWKILARAEINGKKPVVGSWEAPYGETYRTEAEALAGAARKIATLAASRLHIIHLDEWAIDKGEPRSCSCCAIAQALFRKQKTEWKHDNYYFSFEVCPYAGFNTAEGITYGSNRCHASRGEAFLDVEKLPDVVTNWQDGDTLRHYVESMADWAMNFDDWSESECETDEQYKRRTGEDDGKPSRPGEAFFVLNLDEFEVKKPFGCPYSQALFEHAPPSDDDTD